MKFTPVCKVYVHRRGGNAGLRWSAAPIDPTCSLPLLPDGELLYVAEEATKVPPAMIAAAHDVTMKEAGIILNHELFTKIYEAMQSQAAVATATLQAEIEALRADVNALREALEDIRSRSCINSALTSSTP